MSGKEYTKSLPKNPEEYLEQALHPRLHKMAVKASFSKRMFFTLRIIAIIGGVLLPILVSINKEGKYIQVLSIVLSLIIAISIALVESLKFKERYIKFEGLINIANKLKSVFIAKENDFAGLSDEQRITKFASLSGNVILKSQNGLLEAFSSMETPMKK